MAARGESVEKKNAYFGNEGNRFWHFEIGNNRFPNQGEPDLPPDERFLSNAIRTAKYTLLSFLPLNFWH